MGDKATWFDRQKIGAGAQACSAVNGNGVSIVVYVRPNSTTLCYRVGILNGQRTGMVWNDEHQYDSGRNPSVSINDNGDVVAVHETGNNFTRRIFYRVGRVDGTLVDWGQKNGHYDTGFYPSVSINNNGDIAEVHQSANVVSSWELKCWYGKLDATRKTVKWSGNDHYSNGSSPCVSLNNKGELLEVEKTRGDGWGLWYRRGTIDAAAGKLKWSQENPSFGDGFSPCVALTDQGTSIEVNRTFTIINPGYTVTRFGRSAAGGLVNWEPEQQLASGGGGMSVGVNNGSYILVVGEFEPGTLSSQVGCLFTRWMEIFQSRLRNLTLRSVILPGSHDSGTSDMNADSGLSPDADPKLHYFPPSWIVGYARAQGLNIYDQLMSGVRYLDLRVAPKDDQLRFVHSMYAGYVNQAIESVGLFLRENTHEIVILDFQHFYAMTAEQHKALADKLYTELGNLLIERANPSSLILGDLWTKNKRVVVLYSDEDGGDLITKEYPLLWPRDKYIESPWAHTEYIDKLESFLDENTKSPSNEKFFVLQGVLTPDIASYITLWTLEEFARAYNATIMGWASDRWRNRPLNILMTDWVDYGNVVATAVQMNLTNAAAAACDDTMDPGDPQGPAENTRSGEH